MRYIELPRASSRVQEEHTTFRTQYGDMMVIQTPTVWMDSFESREFTRALPVTIHPSEQFINFRSETCIVSGELVVSGRQLSDSFVALSRSLHEAALAHEPVVFSRRMVARIDGITYSNSLVDHCEVRVKLRFCVEPPEGFSLNEAITADLVSAAANTIREEVDQRVDAALTRPRPSAGITYDSGLRRLREATVQSLRNHYQLPQEEPAAPRLYNHAEPAPTPNQSENAETTLTVSGGSGLRIGDAINISTDFGGLGDFINNTNMWTVTSTSSGSFTVGLTSDATGHTPTPKINPHLLKAKKGDGVNPAGQGELF